MRRNQLGQSDLYVSEIGLGCMSLGTDERKALSIVDEALAGGINFLDTADLYDNGHNEELVGKAIRHRRAEVIVATKVGNRRIPGQEGWVWDPSKAYIRAAVKESLRRLGTDYIDLYQLHGGTLDDPMDDTIEAFEELKREGLIRSYGISSIRPNVIREYVRRSTIVSVMNPYSLLDRRAEEEVLPLLAEHHIGVIARGPLAGGVLSAQGEHKAARDDLDYAKEELPALRRQLLELAGPNRSLEQLAIRYALSEPCVRVVIPGASSLEQLRSNLTAADVSLSADEVKTLRAITKQNLYTAHR
ncbi:aldo/keto reductase [Paenibacillus xanthanilyticus]|uniref:Aldo/keto reductase n=1 Tax=Paenibacillus xanthanilyticus TaxID=1783531 RepID=A0ABV8K8R9_9BACL